MIARRIASLLVPMLIVIGLDRLSKWWVRANLWDPPRDLVILPGWLELTPVANRGIAFGMLQDTGAVLALVAVVALAFVALRSWRQVLTAPALVRIPLGMIAGGAIGNVIDRAQIGYVTDFIRVPRIWIFQVFNVSDAAIVVGTVILALVLWRGENRTARIRTAEPLTTTPGPTTSPE
jgi:signal peptidase II